MDLMSIVKPEISLKKNTKKRKRAEFEDDELQMAAEKATNSLVEQFEKEEELEEFYTGAGLQKRINLEELPQFADGRPMYICLDTKDMSNMLDLKKEVILTMLN